MKAQLNHVFRFSLTARLVFPLTACNKDKATNTAPENGTPATEQSETTKVDHTPKKEGKYCFELKEERLSIRGEMKLGADNYVEGFLEGLTTAGDNSKTPYKVQFRGEKVGNKLEVKVNSNEKGNVAEHLETWIWSGNTLIEGEHKLTEGACG